MGYSGKILAAVLLSAAMVLPASAQEAGHGISRDPFAHPDLKTIKTSSVAAQLGRSPEEVIRDEAAAMELRATMRAETGDWAMANINGTMVEQGEEIEGFTLLEIGEMDALLSKEGVEVILLMELSNILPIE